MNFNLGTAIFGLVLITAAAWSQAHLQQPQLVWFDHDGAADDFVVMLMLLSSAKDVKLAGVTIIDADCYASVALNSTVKLLKTVGQHDVPVAVSTFEGSNPFPDVWRASGRSVDKLPLLNEYNMTSTVEVVSTPGEDYFADTIASLPHPIVVIATGPLSNVAYGIKKHGQSFVSKVKELWWMGGAFHVAGNVEQVVWHDNTSEWNSFWDPAAVEAVWQSDIPMVVVPLDATNQVPITPQFLQHLDTKQKYSALAQSVWAVAAQWVHDTPDVPYYAWDTLTAACFLDRELCQQQLLDSTYVIAQGRSQGRTVHGPCPDQLGQQIGLGHCRTQLPVVMDVRPDDFYKFVTSRLSTS